MAVSPDGKEVAYIYRGEVFVSSVDGGMTKQITKTPEQEVSVSFSPDGKSLVYASERGTAGKFLNLPEFARKNFISLLLPCFLKNSFYECK